MTFESGLLSSMCTHRFVEHHFRIIIDFVECLRMWFAPAVCAREVTGVDVGRHLHAATALNAVECAFVAVTIVLQFLFGPVANLDTTMFANEMISLLGELGRNLRFNLRYWALH